MKTLDQLALETTTDRSSNFHDYAVFYGELFDHLRHEPITILEQGVLSGDGLRMWNLWATHPDTRIFGIDIHPDWFDPTGYVRIKTFGGSQDDENFIGRVISESGPLDICIDDAGHFSSQQVRAFGLLWPFVKPGGYYVCEDLNTSWSVQHSDAGPILNFFLQICQELHDHGPEAHGKWTPQDKWDIDWVMFRKGVCVIKKRNSIGSC